MNLEVVIKYYLMEKEMNEEIKELPKPILIEDLGMMYSTESSNKKYRFGIYKCGFCGTEFKAQVQHINSKNTKSCGYLIFR